MSVIEQKVKYGDQSETFEIDLQAKAWIDEKIKSEVGRIKAAGSSAIPVPVKNFGVRLDLADEDQPKKPNHPGHKAKDDVINRIEVGSAMDFTKVRQIMLSEPVDYPFKEGYKYVHVLAFTSAPIPMIIPYIYACSLEKDGEDVQVLRTDSDARALLVKNDLKNWLFINANQQRARHRIDDYHEI